VVEVPLGQIPGGDRNNQNCTAEEKLWCLAITSEVAKKCVHSVQLLWLKQSQNCSGATRQLGALT